MIELVTEGVVAMLPIYSSGGDTVEIVTEKGNVVVLDVTIETFIRNLYRMYSIDRKVQRAQFREHGFRENPPITLGDRVYMKTKTRTPIIKGDSAYGYLDVTSIDHIERGKNTTIHLKNDHVIKSLDRYVTTAYNYCDIYSIYRRLDRDFRFPKSI